MLLALALRTRGLGGLSPVSCLACTEIAGEAEGGGSRNGGWYWKEMLQFL